MAEDQVDQSLFPSKEEAAAAEAVWNAGAEHAARANPIGAFAMEITSAELGRSSGGDRLQIHYHLKIIVGEFAGTEIHKYDGLGSPEQTAITQGQLKRIGVDTSKITMKTLPATLLTLKGKKIVATTKQNGDFFNIYFTKPAGDNPAEAVAGKGKTTAPAAGGKPPTQGKRKF